MPNDCLKARQKWCGLRRTSCARVASDIGSAKCSSMWAVTVRCGEAARPPRYGSFDAWEPGIETYKLVYQDDAEGFTIPPIVRAAVDHCRQFECRLPQRVVFEEQAGCKRRLRNTRLGVER